MSSLEDFLFISFQFISTDHSHKKRKDSLETWDVLLIFRLNLKYLGRLYRAYIKTAQNCDFWEELLSENDFEAVLATFFCYDHGPIALLRQFRRSSQIKKSIANAPRVL